MKSEEFCQGEGQGRQRGRLSCLLRFVPSVLRVALGKLGRKWVEIRQVAQRCRWSKEWKRRVARKKTENPTTLWCTRSQLLNIYTATRWHCRQSIHLFSLSLSLSSFSLQSSLSISSYLFSLMLLFLLHSCWTEQKPSDVKGNLKFG